MSRLCKFVSTGVWPASEGNKPAPRQNKWYDLYQRVCILYTVCITQCISTWLFGFIVIYRRNSIMPDLYNYANVNVILPIIKYIAHLVIQKLHSWVPVMCQDGSLL